MLGEHVHDANLAITDFPIHTFRNIDNLAAVVLGDLEASIVYLRNAVENTRQRLEEISRATASRSKTVVLDWIPENWLTANFQFDSQIAEEGVGPWSRSDNQLCCAK